MIGPDDLTHYLISFTRSGSSASGLDWVIGSDGGVAVAGSGMAGATATGAASIVGSGMVGVIGSGVTLGVIGSGVTLGTTGADKGA